jgi:DNA mismatch repair protein PMS2
MEQTASSQEKGLRRLSRGAIDRMLAGQALPGLHTIVKELVENALDAESPSVRVSISEYGLDWVEVADKGTGIAFESLKVMCQFGGTSKIDEYEDLHQGVQGFGFRGEGLAAMRVVSDLEVVSKVKGANVGYKACYSKDLEEPTITEVNCSEGTIIRIISPFSNEKAKREELTKNCKNFFKNITDTVQTYAVVMPDKLFEIQHYINGKNSTICSYIKTSSVVSRIREVCGYSISGEIGECFYEDDQVNLKAYLTTNVQSGSFKLSQGLKRSDLRVAINNKPADVPSFIKNLMDRIYTQYNANGKYFALLLLTMPGSWLDINMSKDKREMLIKNKEAIAKIINETVSKCLEDVQGVKVVCSQRNSTRFSTSASRDTNQRIREVVETQSNVELKQNNTLNNLQEDKENLLFKESNTANRSSWAAAKSMPEIQSLKLDNISAMIDESGYPDYKHTKMEPETPNFQHQIDQLPPLEPMKVYFRSVTPSANQYADPYTPLILGNRPSTLNSERSSQAADIEHNLGHIDTSLNSKLEEYYPIKRGSESISLEILFQKPTRRVKTDASFENDDIFAKPNTQATRMINDQAPLCMMKKEARMKELRSALISRLKAEDLNEHQEKFVQKHFSELRIIGQFNKGFIICKWKDYDGRYIVIDQHAADEKNNYERLKRDLKVSSQGLVQSIPVKLSLSEFNTLKDNISTFSENGFKVKLSEDSANNEFKVEIIGMPNVFYWRYDKIDFYDLLYLVQNHGSYSEDIMVPKAKREIATKACRSSIKIGDALDTHHMKSIVYRMSELHHPWSCPHGRPSTIIADRIYEPKLDRSKLKARLKTVF